MTFIFNANQIVKESNGVVSTSVALKVVKDHTLIINGTPFYFADADPSDLEKIRDYLAKKGLDKLIDYQKKQAWKFVGEVLKAYGSKDNGQTAIIMKLS